MFLIKKILTQFLMPLPLASLFLGLALGWLVATRRRGAPALAVAAALGLILLGGNGVVADRLLGPLEARHPSFKPAAGAAWADAAIPTGTPAPRGLAGTRPPAVPAAPASPAFVVVLGGGHVSDPSVPLSSQVNEAAVVRLVEGIRLQRLFPGSRLVVSGGRVFDPQSSSRLMADLAVELGVARESIVEIDQALDTDDEARLIRPLVGTAPFLLVTCASHMPRAVALFEREGARPIPAPTHHLVRRRQGPALGSVFPNAHNLSRTERAIHERVGRAYARAGH